VNDHAPLYAADPAMLTGSGLASRVSALYGSDAEVMAPVLALGTFERVGSNWISDRLRAIMPQHNEPFRQQLHGHLLALSESNPPSAVEATATGSVLDALGGHHLTCALADLYGRPRHVVKETNLFSATATVLALLPHSPVIVLTRAPVGIAGSFQRGGLWERWGYANRYTQLAATAMRTARGLSLTGLLPLDDPAPPTALGRLLALNALLLADALNADGRAWMRVSYEEHVEHPETVETDLAALLGTPIPAAALPPAAVASGDFATTAAKTTLSASIAATAARLVTDAVNATLEYAAERLPPQVAATASGWLAGSDRYELHEPATRTRRPAARAASAPAPAQPTYVPAGRDGLTWRTHLATNAEVAGLLSDLHAAGLANTADGTNLFTCPMPHERGGRLHLDASSQRWNVSPGYEQHPAYWMTWLGAATFAAVSGARLPTRAEASALMDGSVASNAEYRHGDVSPVDDPGRAPHDIHHRVGNVQIWCCDGPALPAAHPVQRYLIGAAWNTPATPADIHAERSRYLLGSSRGVGLRLVRDPDRAATLAVEEIATRLRARIDELGSHGLSPGDRDRRLIDALSQADR
jgi:hypothetical protein